MAVQDDTLAQPAPLGSWAAPAEPPAARIPGRMVVHAPRRGPSLRLIELWAYRHLVPQLGMIYVRRKYRGTWLGWLWIPLRPVVTLLSQGLIFGGLLSVRSGDRPYLMFLTIGMAGWLLFDRTCYWGYRAFQVHARLAETVKVPWAAPVFACAVPGLVEGVLYGAIAALGGVYYKLAQGSFYLSITGATIETLFGTVLLLLYACAIAAWTAPLVARVRDLRFVLRYAIGFWYFLTPVLYSPSSLSPSYRALAEYNPLTAPIEYFKDGVLGTGVPSVRSLGVSLLVLAVVLPTGLLFLGRAERRAHARL